MSTHWIAPIALWILIAAVAVSSGVTMWRPAKRGAAP